jgi:hypothetical protein
LVDLIIQEGLINLDLADVKTVLSGMGPAIMGTGEASGEQRAVVAAIEAIVNPLLDDVSLKGARSLLLSVKGGGDLTLWEVDEAVNRVRLEVDPDANIIVGAILDESLGDKLRVSIVASGMPRPANEKSACQFDGPGWTPRSAPRTGSLNGQDLSGRRLSEAFTERNPQGRPRKGRRGGAKARAATSASESVEEAPRKITEQLLVTQPKANGAAKRGAARPARRPRATPSSVRPAESSPLARSPLANAGPSLDWPHRWVGGSEVKAPAPNPAEPLNSLSAERQRIPRRATLLERLTGLVGFKR